MTLQPRFQPAQPGDDAAGLLAQPRRERAAIGRLGVAIGVVGKDLFEDERFDLAQRAARRDVVGIDQSVAAEGTVDHGVVTDHATHDRVYAAFGYRS